MKGIVSSYVNDPKDLAACEATYFLAAANNNAYWHMLVLKDITEEPELKNETYKQFYARAYSLFLKIRKAMNDPNTNAAHFRSLFIEAFKKVMRNMQHSLLIK